MSAVASKAPNKNKRTPHIPDSPKNEARSESAAIERFILRMTQLPQHGKLYIDENRREVLRFKEQDGRKRKFCPISFLFLKYYTERTGVRPNDVVVYLGDVTTCEKRSALIRKELGLSERDLRRISASANDVPNEHFDPNLRKRLIAAAGICQ